MISKIKTLIVCIAWSVCPLKASDNDGEPLKQLIGDYADHHHPVFDPLSQGFPLIDRLRAIERFHNTNNKISAFKLIVDN